MIRSQMLYPLSYERWCPDSLRHAARHPCGADTIALNKGKRISPLIRPRRCRYRIRRA